MLRSMTDWWTVAVSMLGSGGVSAGMFGLLNGHLHRRLTAQIEKSKDQTLQRLKDVDAQIAEADRKSALALRRDDSRMTTLMHVNRLAADGHALAYNATLDSLPDGTPLYATQAYTNSGAPQGEAARDAARWESDAYFFSPELGRAVTRLRECAESLRWEATENRSLSEAFDADEPHVKERRDTASQVRELVQTMVAEWEGNWHSSVSTATVHYRQAKGPHAIDR
ncbi:Uncharacterised protein [Mycobacteroides abscessus subsp. bolletii]|nr:Uncharacterised protein [Mycobacteroides abscessus subsp. bolletii]